jgi:hypothetical protein
MVTFSVALVMAISYLPAFAALLACVASESLAANSSLVLPGAEYTDIQQFISRNNNMCNFFMEIYSEMIMIVVEIQVSNANLHNLSLIHKF